MALNLEAAGAAGRKSKVDGLHKRGMALAEGLIYGCPLVPIESGRVCTLLNQQLHHLLVAVEGGPMQGCGTFQIACTDVRLATTKEKPHDGNIAIGGGHVQRCPAEVVGSISVCACRQRCRHVGLVAIPCALQQQRLPLIGAPASGGLLLRRPMPGATNGIIFRGCARHHWDAGRDTRQTLGSRPDDGVVEAEMMPLSAALASRTCAELAVRELLALVRV